MRLQGKVALVTGAAGGIGAATALRFAREGALVAVNDAKADGLEAVADDIRKAGAKALVAGINRDAMAAKMTEEQWDAVLDVNLKGTFLFADGGMSVGI